jgi:hypothetical protein
MGEQHRISYVKLGGGGTAYGGLVPSGTDGYISALNLWQGGPVSMGTGTEDVIYTVEVTCFTVSDPYYPYYPNYGEFGDGMTRRVGAYRLADGYDGVWQLVSQSDVEWLGGQVYPEFFASFGHTYYGGDDPLYHPEFHIQFRLALNNGYYLHTRYYIKIEAWQYGT